MSQEIVKAQHYVPVFYLNNFVDSSGKLHVYDREAGKVFTCLPKNICKSDLLYETPWEHTKADLGKYVLCNKIEKSFSEYEGQYAALVKRILQICVPSQNPHAIICSHENKIGLISLIVNLFVRNPWVMEYFQLNEIPEELNNHPICATIKELMEILILGGADSLLKYSMKYAYLLEHDEGGLAHDMMEEIEKLNFTFYYSKEGKFITSSCPSCVGNFSDERAFAHLPLSPFVVVCFGNDTVPRRVNNRMKILDASETTGINSIYQSFDTKQARYIISNSGATLKKFLS